MSVTVIRGDCFDVLNDEEVLGAVDLVIADPPYGKILDGVKWDVECYERLGCLLDRILKPNGTAFVWGGIGKHLNRPFFKWLACLEERIPPLQIWDVITWKKKRAYGCTDRLLFVREECAMIVKGNKPKTFNIPLLDKERGYAGYSKKYPAKSKYLRRTNVWDDVTEILRGKIHDAEKPDKLAEIMIRMSSNDGDFVVDPFAGSGSTGKACLNVGNRECLLIEKSDCEMHALSVVQRVLPAKGAHVGSAAGTSKRGE